MTEDPANGTLFVSTAAGVAVINMSDDQVVANISIGGAPVCSAYDGLNGDLYVYDYSSPSQNISVVNATTYRIVTTIRVGFSVGCPFFDPVNRLLYLATGGAVGPPRNVTIINTSKNTVQGSIALGSSFAVDIAIDPTTNTLFVANGVGDQVVVINGTTNTVSNSITIPGGSSSTPIWRVAIDPPAGFLYALADGSDVAVINVSTQSVVRTFPLAAYGPNDMADGGPSGTIFVSEYDTQNVTELDALASRSVGSVPLAPRHPLDSRTDGLVYDAARGKLFVAEFHDFSVGVLSVVGVGLSPTSVALPAGSSANLSALPLCLVGPCSRGASFSWTLQNGLATLNSSSGPVVKVTAGSTVGLEHLFLNATVKGATVAPLPATISIVPALSFVTVAPTTATLSVGGLQPFTAAIACSGGPCPPGTNYSWTLSAPLGRLNTSWGPQVLFTAGNVGGNATLFLNVSLDGIDLAAAPVPLTVLPLATSVAITPGSATVPTGTSRAFNATLTCFGGPCPGGASYGWSMTGGLGTLVPGPGPRVTFTAGVSPGALRLFVNVTLNGVRVQSPGVPVTVVPRLTSVAVSPASALLPLGASQTFGAALTCQGGPCPGGAAYAWGLTNGLASLNVTVGATVDLRAGGSVGTVSLVLNATLDGIEVAAASVPVAVVPALTSVGVVPASVTVGAWGTQVLTAAPVCQGGPCPGGSVYAWELRGGLGTVNASTGSTVQFRAGGEGGGEVAYVNVTLDGRRAGAEVPIGIEAPPTSPTPVSPLVYVDGALAGVLLGLAVWSFLPRRGRGRKGGGAKDPTPRSG